MILSSLNDSNIILYRKISTDIARSDEISIPYQLIDALYACHHHVDLRQSAIHVSPNILLILEAIEFVRMHIIQSSVSQHTLYLVMKMAIIDR